MEIVDRIRDLGWQGVVGNTDEMLFRPESLEELWLCHRVVIGQFVPAILTKAFPVQLPVRRQDSCPYLPAV